MTPAELEQELIALETGLRNILDYQGKDAIAQAKGRIQKQKKLLPLVGKKRGKKPHCLELEIPPDSPLRFVENPHRDYRFQVDLFCKLFHPLTKTTELFGTLTIRIWSLDQHLCFREGLDSEHLQEKFGEQGKRVLVRFHFDRANPKQDALKYHLQIGGVHQEGEYCWYPEALTIPRFVHHPIGLFLACEYIVANFFPEEYKVISEEPGWTAALRKSQEYFVEPYIQQVRGWKSEVSLLQHLWSHEEAN